MLLMLDAADATAFQDYLHILQTLLPPTLAFGGAPVTAAILACFAALVCADF
jgi:hypothetical protein